MTTGSGTHMNTKYVKEQKINIWLVARDWYVIVQ